MATKRLKRPSSARRHIKQETFSSFVSSTRLRRLQSMLRDGNGDCPDSADAIVCIYGIDSRYNDGNSELVDYLLFDFFKLRRTEIERLGIPEEIVDDMMFVVRRHSVDVYCNPINYHYLLPYVAHWRSLHIHCLTDEDYEDEEKAEEFKIQSFIRMLDGCHTVAVPYSTTGHQGGAKFDKMSLEKWPIIQAYALEGFGGGGFFTMRHEVIDLSASIHRVYQEVDPVSVETIVTQQLPLFEKQWTSVLDTMDIDRSRIPGGITEDTVGEALRSYFNHGRIRTNKDPSQSTPSREPFVAFGQNTTRSRLTHQGAEPSRDSSIESSGVQGRPAQHMICQAVAPRGPLGCTRTYFFGSGTLPHPVNEVDQQPQLPEKNDLQLLIGLYQGCIHAVNTAITVYTNTLSIQQAQHAATDCLLSWCETQELPVNSRLLARMLHFQLQAFDNANRCVPLEEGSTSLHVKSASLTLYDIPSLESPDATLGSVCFAETFMNSTILSQATDGSTEIDGECTVLTSHIPPYIIWPLEAHEHSCAQLITLQLQQPQSQLFGEQLMNAENVCLLTGGATGIKIDAGRLYMYEEGVVYTHIHHGILVIPVLELSALHLYDGDSPSAVCLLIMTYKEHLRRYIPPHLRSDGHQVFLAFQPKTKAFKAFNRQVLPVWKQSSVGPPLHPVETLPQELQAMHSGLQSEYELAARAPSSVSPLNQAKMQLPDLHSFLKHFEAGSVGSEPVARRHLPALSNDLYDEGSFDSSDELIVTILSGLPGGGKNSLCTTLTKLAREDSRWAVLHQPIDSPDTFSAEQLQASLSATWKAQRRRKPGNSSKMMRTLLVTPGFTDVVDVVQAVVSHPDTAVAKHLHIGAVTACVDPDSVFMCDNYWLPRLLDQCAQGWVNNVVFTVPDAQNVNLSRVQHLVRAANSDVALLLAPRGDITRSTDVDLILSDSVFSEPSMLHARYLSCPGWWCGRYVSGPERPAMSDVVLRFSQPLEKPRLLSRLKGLRGSHVKYPFNGNVYHIRGRAIFTDSAQPQELEYVVLTGALTVTPAELRPTPPSSNGPSKSDGCCLIFTGCGLLEDRLRDWLRGCARQKPQKKVIRTRQSLTKAEINRVHKENHLQPLPEGWFYNGSHFVSLAGDKSDTHPDLEDFLTQYLQKVNMGVNQHNKTVDQQDFHDLFETMSSCRMDCDL